MACDEGPSYPTADLAPLLMHPGQRPGWQFWVPDLRLALPQAVAMQAANQQVIQPHPLSTTLSFK